MIQMRDYYLQYYLCYKEAFLLGMAFGVFICYLCLQKQKKLGKVIP
jgi:hypothetical protein